MPNNKYWIPRNLNEDDVLKLGLGIKLKLQDIPFLTAGGLFSYVMLGSIPSIIIKFGATSIIMTCSYFLAKVTVDDKPLNQVVGDSFIYGAHQTQYKKERRNRK